MAECGIEGAQLDGPLAFENAISREAAVAKGLAGPVVGDPDILLFPDLGAGNTLAKQLQYLAGAESAGQWWAPACRSRWPARPRGRGSHAPRGARRRRHRWASPAFPRPRRTRRAMQPDPARPAWRRLRAASLALSLLAPFAAPGCDEPAEADSAAAAPGPPPPRPAGLDPAQAGRQPSSEEAEAVAAAASALGYRLMPDFETLAARVMPAVVSIAVTAGAAPALPPPLRGTPFERQFRERYGGEAQPPVVGAGSGFLLDPSGLVVTNRHVVGGAAVVTVSLHDGTRMPARVLGTDPIADAALLQVEARRPLPYVALGDSDSLRIGQWVLAAGNPFGLGGSATSGIVSALGRNIGVGPFDDFIQTDAAINPGNSGGPLFNLAGEVVGVNTAIYSPSGANAGIGFATPAARLRPVIEALATGRPVVRGWLGIAMAESPAGGRADPGGVLLQRVLPGGPADRAGLRSGDVLLALDGRPVAGVPDVVRRIAATPPGQIVAVTLRRGGKEQAVEVTVEQRPNVSGAG
jgi:serine protease Do